MFSFNLCDYIWLFLKWKYYFIFENKIWIGKYIYAYILLLKITYLLKFSQLKLQNVRNNIWIHSFNLRYGFNFFNFNEKNYSE